MKQSIWNSTAELPRFPSLNQDLKTKVLIIGGGIAGLLTAYYLHQRGLDYILVEQGRIAGKITGNTTAKVTFQHGLTYHQLKDPKGYLEANRQAFHEYERLCKKLNCDYQRKDHFVYSLYDRSKLVEELEVLHRIGYSATLEEDLPLPFLTKGAVRFPNQAQFHPLKFLNGIVKELHIYENTPVRQLAENTAWCDGGKIQAENIVVATHFPFINKHGSYFLKLYQSRSYVIALKGAPDLGGMYLDEQDAGLSFRNYGDYLLLGGGGHRTGYPGGNWNVLRNFAHHYYPEAKEVCFWAAQDCMSLDHMPYIGSYSGLTKGLYVACGFNKWGMTGAMTAAQILADQLCGKKNEFSKLFSPSRSMLHTQLLINSFESMKNLLSGSEKRCPHLGCALKWNEQEHSWDCPCHGSRFSEKGRLLDNPATGDLK